MNECQPISEGEPVRQGDVFVSHPASQAPTPSVSIVITADCDLAQGKSGRDALCLSVTSADRFVRETWIDDKWAGLETEIRAMLSRIVNTAHLALDARARPLTDAFIADWVDDAGVDPVATTLDVGADIRARMTTIADALCRARSAPGDLSFDALIDLYFDLRVELGLVAAATKRANRVNELKSILGVARQDTLFISTIPGQERDGWMVQLRRSATVPLSRLVCDRLSWFDDRSSLLRVGRLTSVYKHALAQQFGQLFARIGLPSEYEGWKGMVVTDICSALYPEGNRT